jgi:hypothetical protein
MIKTFETTEGMSLYDVALHTYSGFDNMIKFLVDNDINSINHQSVGTREIIFDTDLNPDLSLSNVIGKRGFVFATVNVGIERVTEDRIVRITEDGARRIIE